MYAIVVDMISPYCFNITNDDVRHLWHCRYDHLSQKDLKILV